MLSLKNVKLKNIITLCPLGTKNKIEENGTFRGFFFLVHGRLIFLHEWTFQSLVLIMVHIRQKTTFENNENPFEQKPPNMATKT